MSRPPLFSAPYFDDAVTTSRHTGERRPFATPGRGRRYSRDRLERVEAVLQKPSL